MSESLDDLADAVESLEERVADAAYETLRARVRDGDTAGADALERRLGRARRALAKAAAELRGD
ncbi:MAG TPA: hypothetical protein VGS61_07465 [Acidimicrobiales bacterium]|nr:hypothetical protein [Acidimicrobiales bacterium]